MLHSGRPFRRFLRAFVCEQTFGLSVFELYQKVGLVMRIADRQVADEISKQIVFNGDEIRIRDGRDYVPMKEAR